MNGKPSYTLGLLVVEGIGGDDSAFAGAIYPSLVRRAAQLVGSQDAEDLVQEAFAALYRRRPVLHSVPHMRAYVGTTMFNLVRQRARRSDVLDQAASIEVTPWLV
jgi:DNA-directed RNA polymerase specialized sigma24 family protein